MTKRNRNTLKNYFLNGSVPNQDQFKDLIDSNLNIIDEGFDKSPDEGLKVSQLGDSGRLISFFKDNLTGRLNTEPLTGHLCARYLSAKSFYPTRVGGDCESGHISRRVLEIMYFTV